jgi:hypothetical protein
MWLVWREEKCIQDLVGKLKGKRPLGIPRLDGRIVLSGFSRTRMGVVDWINLAQDRDNRRLL